MTMIIRLEIKNYKTISKIETILNQRSRRNITFQLKPNNRTSQLSIFSFAKALENQLNDLIIDKQKKNIRLNELNYKAKSRKNYTFSQYSLPTVFLREIQMQNLP